jgi:hypothetical protein
VHLRKHRWFRTNRKGCIVRSCETPAALKPVFLGHWSYAASGLTNQGRTVSFLLCVGRKPDSADRSGQIAPDYVITSSISKKKKKKNRHGLALGCCLFSIAETLVTNFRVDNHGDSVTLLPISKFVRTGQAITVGLCFYLLFKRSHKVRSVCCPKTINFNFINHQKKYINPRIYMMANYEPLLLLRTTSTLKELWFRKSECWEVEVLCSGPIWESSGLRSRELF